MDTRVEQLVTQAMALRGESRALRAELLVESLEADDLGPLDRAWITEAKRRRHEVRSGQIEPIEGEAALKYVRDSLT